MEKVRIKEGVLRMRFDDIYKKQQLKKLTCEEAALLLNVSVRTFLRHRNRQEEEGFDGRFDRRLGRVSTHRAADSEIEFMTNLYKQRYQGFSVKHFHEFLQREHEFTRGYTFVKNELTEAGLIKPSKRGGPHRQRRERRPMAGMMLLQDGSTHDWLPDLGYKLDLIATIDDATSEVTSLFLVEEEGIMSTFQAIKETIERYGLFCSLYTDRGSHYWWTPEAGGKVSKTQLTEVGRALKQLGIQHIAAYSPQAKGRVERLFQTLQGRLPQEFGLYGIKTIEQANRYLKEVYLPRHNKDFRVEARDQQLAYTPWIGINLDEILCIQEERVVQNDNTVRYNNRILQIARNDMRYHYVKTDVVVKEYISGDLSVFYGHRCLGRYNASGQALKQRDKKAA